ncbi:MAG: MFS transporter [Gammaproteobacteria bacterium]
MHLYKSSINQDKYMSGTIETGGEPNIIRQRIDEGGLTPGIIIIVALCFILNMFDGFDVVAMSVAMPALAEAWGLSGDLRGYILSAALLGMALGAMLLAPLCDRLGRRRMIIYSSVVTGSCMIITSLLPQSVVLMIGIRVVTGLGIGVILVSTAAVVAEFTPQRWRNFAVPLAISGYPFGAMLISPIAEYVLPNYGWEYLFMLGGILTLTASIALFVLLPESISFMATQSRRNNNQLPEINVALTRIGRAPIETIPAVEPAPKAGRVASILTHAYRVDTVKLWIAFFAAFATLYFLLSWIPSLFVNSGLTRAEGIRALFFFNLGGIVGIYTIGMITSWLHLGRTISLYYFLTAAAMLYFSIAQLADPERLNILIFVTGMGMHGAFAAMYAVAARVYAVTERATGIGWSIGLGRIGAIVSPSIAGLLLTLGWTMYPMFVLFAMPILLSAFLVATVKLRV